jgi:GH25 family lysozyme M1 (1,4-beta-N-acetylmuramidase)
VTARIARQICDVEPVGYSQGEDRRSWYANADWAGRCSSPQNADCSSLAAGAVCYGLHDTYGVPWGHPALPEINDHWTGNLRPGLEARGFDEVPWADENLTPDGGFRAGDIVLSAANEGGVGHVIIIVEDGYDPLESEAWIAETGDLYGERGDQTGQETHTARYSEHPYTQRGAWTSCHRFNEAKFFQQWPEFAKGKAQAKSAAPTQAQAAGPQHAHGIDISSHQGGLNVGAIWADFVIVKITEGTGYENPYWRTQAEATLAAGKRLGLYLFANDEDAGEQARFFLDRAKAYAGRATFWLDWEADALNLAPSDALVILNQMAAETGSTPGIYLNGAGMESGDWSAIAGRFPLWYAGGPNYASYGQAYSDPPTPTVPYWGGNVLIHQYTEDGYLPGYNSHLDLDRLRDRATWDRMIGGGQVVSGAPSPVSTSSLLQVDGEYGPATMKRLIDVFAPGYSEMFAVANLRRYLNSTVASSAQRMLIGADKLPEDRGWDSHVIRIFQYWAWCCVRPVAPEMWSRFADGWSFGEYVDGEPGEATWAALQEALNRSRPGSFRLM